MRSIGNNREGGLCKEAPQIKVTAKKQTKSPDRKVGEIENESAQYWLKDVPVEQVAGNQIRKEQRLKKGEKG